MICLPLAWCSPEWPLRLHSRGWIPLCPSTWPESISAFRWIVLIAEDKEAPLAFVLLCWFLLEGNLGWLGIARREVTGCHQVCVQGLSVTFKGTQCPGWLQPWCSPAASVLVLGLFHCTPLCGASWTENAANKGSSILEHGSGFCTFHS